MKIFCISDNTDTFTGMRLAGVDGAVVHTPQELADVVGGLTAEKYALVLVTPIVKSLGAELLDASFGGDGQPLLYVVPDRHGGVTEGASEAIKSALGR